MYGIELEGFATPIEGLNLRAVFNYIYTETIDYYSLDTAANDDIFQDKRLSARADNEATNLPFPGPSTSKKCNPPGQPGEGIWCGALGDRDGLDDYSGNELSRSPQVRYTLSADYDIPLGRFGTITPGVKYSWSDDTYYRVFNRDFDLQEAYHKTDAKLIWKSPETRWTAEVFVDNIEDEATKDYILIGSRLFGAPPLAWYGAPRFYGFSIGFKY
jgi:hypothetical protein